MPFDGKDFRAKHDREARANIDIDVALFADCPYLPNVFRYRHIDIRNDGMNLCGPTSTTLADRLRPLF